MADYRTRYVTWFRPGALHGLRVVVFEHSSVARDFLGELLTELGAHVIPVGRSERFIPVDTEAVRNPEELAEWVQSHRADALVSADGDGDRPLLVDDQGKLVRGDVLGILVSALLQADSVSAPISCNTALEKCGRFPRIDRTRIGSPFVIASMQKAIAAGCRRVVGYEANGGFLLGGDLPNPDGSAILKALPTRDAALPLLACLFEVARRRTRLSELVASLPARFTASGLLRDFPIETSKAILATFQGDRRQAVSRSLEARFGRMEAIDFTDGVRMTFDGGEIVHLRPSGNAPEFRCYTESGSEASAAANNSFALEIVRNVLAGEGGTGGGR